MNWLFKEEPTHYSYDDLVRDGKTSWSGVKNPLAQKHLRKTGKLVTVDVAPVKKLPRPVTLAEVKAKAFFKDFPLVRISRLSVMPVSDREWAEIEKIAGSS